jgi:hypothetical protein
MKKKFTDKYKNAEKAQIKRNIDSTLVINLPISISLAISYMSRKFSLQVGYCITAILATADEIKKAEDMSIELYPIFLNPLLTFTKGTKKDNSINSEKIEIFGNPKTNILYTPSPIMGNKLKKLNLGNKHKIILIYPTVIIVTRIMPSLAIASNP